MSCPVEESQFVRGFNPEAGHYGVDLAVNVGSPVRATAAGTIIRVADNPTYVDRTIE